MNHGRNENEKIIGVLHDLVEDTPWTFEQLQHEGFSEEIIAALRCLTKMNEEEDYTEFINRVKVNSVAIRVKLNDLTDNLDVKRLQEVTEKDVIRLNKYLKAYRELIQCL